MAIEESAFRIAGHEAEMREREAALAKSKAMEIDTSSTSEEELK